MKKQSLVLLLLLTASFCSAQTVTSNVTLSTSDVKTYHAITLTECNSWICSATHEANVQVGDCFRVSATNTLEKTDCPPLPSTSITTSSITTEPWDTLTTGFNTHPGPPPGCSCGDKTCTWGSCGPLTGKAAEEQSCYDRGGVWLDAIPMPSGAVYPAKCLDGGGSGIAPSKHLFNRPIDMSAIPEVHESLELGDYATCRTGLELRTRMHCSTNGICFDSGPECYGSPRCDEKDRILIGPDGNGKYFCHLPQTE